MSNNPILLDSTGQQIVTKLNDIKDNLITTDYVKTINGIGVTSGTHNVVLPNVFTPQIYIKAPSGANITVTDGITTLIPTESGVGTGTYIVSIPSWGDWTVVVNKALSETKTISKTVVVTVDEVKRYNVAVQFIYGAVWSGQNTSAFTRTNDSANFKFNPYCSGVLDSGKSDFDNCYPWSEMVDVTENDADYSVVSQFGDFVRIPKYYYKWTKIGECMSLQICPYQVDNTWHCSPAHADRGDGKGERDVVYISKWHSSSNDLKSRGSDNPKTNWTRAQFRSALHGLDATNGTTWMLDYAMLCTYNMLYLVESADWDVQTVIGYGRGNGSGIQACNAGGTFAYHSGTPYSSRTTYGVSCKYRNVVGMWDNVAMWCDGISFNGATVYSCLNPANYNDTPDSNYVEIATRPTSSDCWIKSYTVPSVSGFEYAIIPSTLGTSTSSNPVYVKDGYMYASTAVLCVGGDYGRNLNDGLFLFHSSCSPSATVSYFGSRLQILP